MTKRDKSLVKAESDNKNPLKKKTITEKKTSPLQKEPQTMEELLATANDFTLGVKKGETVEGVIVSVNSREALIDIGRKSFGVVAEWEIEHMREYIKSLKVGDKVQGQVVASENELGYIVLSLRRSSMERRWSLLSEAKETGKDLEVVVLDIAKGGLLVDWQGLRGFIPSTQLEGNFAGNPTILISKRIKVKVLEVDKSLNRLVVSQKASVLGVTPKFQRAKLEKIKPNDILHGVISGIAPFGIFVDIEGLEGLVHISEIAWEKVENPSMVFKVNEKIEVLVLDVNLDQGKLNLSIKRLTPDPWKNILDRYPLESSISGEVVRSAPYGVFVKLEPGIEGLLHISKITPGEEPKIGEKIECLIEKIDPVKRKISLTLVPKEKPVGYR